MRETGPVRKQLDGDSEAAAPYIGPARTLLGVLKNQMQFSGLAQGWRGAQLPDGTVLAVTSRYGQDRVWIISPETGPAEIKLTPAQEESLPLPEPLHDEPKKEPFQTRAAAVCGISFFPPLAPGGFDHATGAFLWQPGKEPIDLGLPGDAVTARAYDISTDGRTVVGGCAFADSTEGAWRWTASGGIELLPGVPAGTVHGTAATGVSHDGKIIVGYGEGPDGPSSTGMCWVWTEAAGMQYLQGSQVLLQPASGAGPIVAPRISPNGKFITGFGVSIEPVDTGVTGSIARGILWQNAGGEWVPTLYPSTAKRKWQDYNGLGPTTNGTINIYFQPAAVADTGAACGNGPFAMLATADGAMIQITPLGNATDPPVVLNSHQVGGFSGEVTQAIAITPDGGRVAGEHARVTQSVDPLFFAYDSAGLHDGEQGQVWDIAADGNSYVGSLLQDEPYTGGIQPFPKYWAKGGMQDIPLVAGAIYGTATAIAMQTLYFDEDGIKKVPQTP